MNNKFKDINKTLSALQLQIEDLILEDYTNEYKLLNKTPKELIELHNKLSSRNKLIEFKDVCKIKKYKKIINLSFDDKGLPEPLVILEDTKNSNNTQYYYTKKQINKWLKTLNQINKKYATLKDIGKLLGYTGNSFVSYVDRHSESFTVKAFVFQGKKYYTIKDIIEDYYKFNNKDTKLAKMKTYYTLLIEKLRQPTDDYINWCMTEHEEKVIPMEQPEEVEHKQQTFKVAKYKNNTLVESQVITAS